MQEFLDFLNTRMGKSIRLIYKSFVFMVALSLVRCTGNMTKDNVVFKYGHGMDSIRKNLGLPLLSKSLVNSEYGTDFIVFETRKPYSYPSQVTKTVFWDSAGVYLERNFFYKSDTEKLIISYWFKSTAGANLDTMGLLHYYSRGKTDTGRGISKVVSDSILGSWGLSSK